MSTQFIKNPFTSRFCEQMNVPGTHDRQVASYLIGTPNRASITNPGFMAVCFNCAKSIVQRLPDELLVFVDVEKALSLMSEEARDAVFDKFYEDSDPREVLAGLLESMDEKELEDVLAIHGYSLNKILDPGDGFPVQQTAQEPDLLKCPHCDFTTTNPNALRGHIGGKHKGAKQE